MDPKTRAAVDAVRKALADGIKRVAFGTTFQAKIADEIRGVVEKALAPHAQALAQRIKVEAVPAQPGDDPNLFRATITVPTSMLQTWPADRILAAGFSPSAVLAVYGIRVIENSKVANAVENFRVEKMEAEVAAFIAEREIELRGTSDDWTRRIYFEVES